MASCISTLSGSYFDHVHKGLGATGSCRGAYNQLTKLGFETLLDDRDERAGVKFKDSSLIGIPVTLVVGKEAAQGRVEYLERASAAGKEVLEKLEAVSRIQEFFSQLN